MKNINGLLLVMAMLMANFQCCAAIQTVSDEIRREATLPSNNAVGRPLPLAASWNTGIRSAGFNPSHQMQLIDEGHHLLPWFQLDMPEGRKNVTLPVQYYRDALKRCAELRLPITLISTQWERLLSESQKYLKLDPSMNPNVVKADGSVDPAVSPFGPAQLWSEVGTQWTSTDLVRQLQSWYPKPPLVLFLSNNEHRKLHWQHISLDRRHRAQSGDSDESKRQIVGDAWVQRYRALQGGLRKGLINDDWKQESLFIGYDAFGSLAFGRWGRWTDYSLIRRNRIEPWPLAWDGGSPSFYVHDWDESTDYTVFSPLIGAMNWVFMEEQARQLNPNFWFELSVWDGHQPRLTTDKRKAYTRLGQTYNPERYAGMLKYAMWLLRPRVVREFRNPDEQFKDAGPYFMELIRAVDQVYREPILAEFWRHGKLVPNRAGKHPYQANIPAEYLAKDRWFLLDTSRDPKKPWTLSTQIPVFALALEKGNAPKRQWLIIIHAPLGDEANVEVSIPGYGKVKVNAPRNGRYYRLDEANRGLDIVGI